MLKVLITSQYNSSNTYVKDIVDALQNFCEVVCDLNSFWNSNLSFDIIHIQWPEELLHWSIVKDEDLVRIQERLDFWKNKGTKLVITRHNEISHRKGILDRELYNLIYENVQAVIHLGEFSLLNFEFKNLINVIIQHPNYLSIYNQIDKNVARKKIKVPSKGNMFLSFGAIRNNEEEGQIIKAFKKIRKPDDYLYITNSKIKNAIPSLFRDPIARIIYTINIKRLNSNHVFLNSTKISNDSIKYFFNAADVIITPRIDSLNSGVVYLGYSFSKIVIGPKVGNMKELLEKNGNPTFIPKDYNSIGKAMVSALSKLDSNISNQNFDFVRVECDPKKIAQLHFDLYRKV